MSHEVMILGASGRTGRAIAQRLDRAGVSLTLHGRDQGRLQSAAAPLTRRPRLLTGTLDGLGPALASAPPAVVLNTVGPFAATTPGVLDALGEGTDYVDLSNEYASFAALFDRDARAVAAGQTLVPGAGFGIVATESVLVALLAAHPGAAATAVRVDALPSLATAGETVGAALAGSIVDGLPVGRVQIRAGALTRRAFDDTPLDLVTPDGDSLTSVNFPSGDLFAAGRISGAAAVVAGSCEVPSGAVIRYGLPVVGLLAHSSRVRRLMQGQLAKAKLPERARPRPHSYGRVSVTFTDGARQEGWMAAGDAMDFTAAAAAEVVQRLLNGQGRPGAHTPRRNPLMSPDNAAAWLNARPGRLEVGPAPYPTPGPNQMVVRNAAVAVNPVDWIIPISRAPVYSWIKQSAVIGYDVAGEVVAVGSGVTRFGVGDRVCSLALGAEKDHNDSAEGAFQLYPVLSENVTAPIPDAMTYEQAAVFPLGLSTAACGLFQTRQLGLSLPTAAPEPRGQTLLVWGGATSVGANAIQLAVAAGYEVITTCSPRNNRLMADLGVRECFDYHAPDVTAQLIAALKDRPVAGAMSLGTGSAQPCIAVLSAGQGNRFLAQAAAPLSPAGLGDGDSFPLFLLRFMGAAVAIQVAAVTRRVKTAFIAGASLANDSVGPAIFTDFLPAALAEGRFRAAPEPRVVGHGLESIQAALDLQRAGVSAQKLVVTLGDGPAPRS
jgi:NADPH:quinone reductase-like Zn-dependent oxidoreductase/short subunit dehydrogenase-like uncharacterized protein